MHDSEALIMFAYTQPNPEIGQLIMFVMGALMVGLFWWLIYWGQTQTEHYHERYVHGTVYSTKKAHRIVGITAERIADGQLVSYIKSLWKGWDGKFFILHIDEFQPPKITPIKVEDAKKFVEKVAATETIAFKLLRDWFNKDAIF